MFENNCKWYDIWIYRKKEKKEDCNAHAPTISPPFRTERDVRSSFHTVNTSACQAKTPDLICCNCYVRHKWHWIRRLRVILPSVNTHHTHTDAGIISMSHMCATSGSCRRRRRCHSRQFYRAFSLFLRRLFFSSGSIDADRVQPL